jgi:hypothetical protein
LRSIKGISFDGAHALEEALDDVIPRIEGMFVACRI